MCCEVGSDKVSVVEREMRVMRGDRARLTSVATMTVKWGVVY